MSKVFRRDRKVSGDSGRGIWGGAHESSASIYWAIGYEHLGT